MGDTPDDPDSAGRWPLDEAGTGSLRERMRNHLAANEPLEDLKTFRRSVALGEPLSEVVGEARDERV